MKNFYKENRVFSILMFVAITCVAIIMGFMILYFFKGQGSNKYGDRLDGIKEVTINNKKIKENSDAIAQEKGIEKATINLEGKIIYTVIYLKPEGVSSDGVNASLKSLELYTEEEREFYDYQFVVEKKPKDEAEPFPIMGYKNSDSANLVWTKY